ncbi:PAS domain-containing protein [Pseudaquidulcibacter saccharophilus]|uniref:PAS domain-containing protein n=1 Tax=Pseudaquidulcibacter saccharophilus TaxID=2831900 RepID=UPI001EFF5509
MENFRSRLVLDEQRFLFDVWRMAAAGKDMPSRKTFSPCGFGPLLPFISLIEATDGENYKVRVVGSNLRDIFSSDPKETLLKRGICGSIDTIEEIINNKNPECGLAEIQSISRHGQERHWLRLPLGENGIVNAVIGLDLCIGGTRAPVWAMQFKRSA